MAAKFTNKQLMEFLIKSFAFVPYEDQGFGLVDLYGKEKVSQILGTNNTDHYVFTLLQKKKEDGKYFSRAIAGGVWKEYGTAESLEDSEGSQIAIMKKYRLVEDNYVWTMKEYSLTESKRNELKQKYEFTAHDEFVMCHIRMKANFSVSSSSQCQENEDSALVPSDDMKESQLPAAIEEECSVSVSQKKNALVHQETPSAKEEEHSVSEVHQETPSAKEEEHSVSGVHQGTPSAKEEEHSVSGVHQENPSAKEEEHSVSGVHQETPSAKEEEYTVSGVHQETPSAKEEEYSVSGVHQETPSAKEEDSVSGVHQETSSAKEEK